jgi:Ca2+/Na+ antiporter
MNYLLNPLLRYPIINYPIIYPNNVVLINAMIDDDKVLYNVVCYFCKSFIKLFVDNIMYIVVVLNVLLFVLFYVFYYKSKKMYEEQMNFYKKQIDELEWKNVLINNRIENINCNVLYLKRENEQFMEEIYYEIKKIV